MGDAEIINPRDRIGDGPTCGVLKVWSIVSQIDPLVLTMLVAMPPLNITQADVVHFLFPKFNNTGEDRLI